VITIDPDKDQVSVDTDDGVQTYGLSSPEAFAAISKVWLRAGWDTKYVYSFTWHGRPIIQLPDDLVRIQEVVFSVAPDVIIETGVAHGGSLVFYAGLCKIMGRGRVVGIDVEIRPHNRAAIEAHPLAPYITLIEGS
jgi:cephalosporin hydroxylase